jgi:hypothetical protein
MNRFRRVKGDINNNFEGVDGMVQELREIAWGVLGRLDEVGLGGTCVWDTREREAKVWAIGHWYVSPSGCRLKLLYCTSRSGLLLLGRRADDQSYRYSLVVEVYPDSAKGMSSHNHNQHKETHPRTTTPFHGHPPRKTSTAAPQK